MAFLMVNMHGYSDLAYSDTLAWSKRCHFRRGHLQLKGDIEYAYFMSFTYFILKYYM